MGEYQLSRGYTVGIILYKKFLKKIFPVVKRVFLLTHKESFFNGKNHQIDHFISYGICNNILVGLFRAFNMLAFGQDD